VGASERRFASIGSRPFRDLFTHSILASRPSHNASRTSYKGFPDGGGPRSHCCCRAAPCYGFGCQGYAHRTFSLPFDPTTSLIPWMMLNSKACAYWPDSRNRLKSAVHVTRAGAPVPGCVPLLDSLHRLNVYFGSDSTSMRIFYHNLPQTWLQSTGRSGSGRFAQTHTPPISAGRSSHCWISNVAPTGASFRTLPSLNVCMRNDV